MCVRASCILWSPYGTWCVCCLVEGRWWEECRGRKREPFVYTVYQIQNTVLIEFWEGKNFASPMMLSTGPSEGNLQSQRSRNRGWQVRIEVVNLSWIEQQPLRKCSRGREEAKRSVRYRLKDMQEKEEGLCEDLHAGQSSSRTRTTHLT